MQDKVLKCKDCGGEFVWTAGEQGFYEAQGFTEPKRCRDCRAEKRRKREEREAAERY